MKTSGLEAICISDFSMSPTLQHGFTVRGETRDSLWHSVREIWRFRPLIWELMRRDLKVRYKNRVGGVLWSLFPPLMYVLTLTLLAKLIFRTINNYSAYLIAVIFLWQFFQNTVLDASNSLLVNAPLTRKIYFPRAVLPIVAMLSNLLHLGIAFVFVLIYFFAVPISDPIYPKNFQSQFWWVFPIAFFTGVLALGVGFLLAYLTTLYDDVKFLSTQFLTLFFYAIPVLYPIEQLVDKPTLYAVYLLNPLAAFIVGFQRALLPPLGDPTNPAIPLVGVPTLFVAMAFLTSFVILVFGFWIFERSKWTMMERL